MESQIVQQGKTRQDSHLLRSVASSMPGLRLAKKEEDKRQENSCTKMSFLICLALSVCAHVSVSVSVCVRVCVCVMRAAANVLPGWDLLGGGGEGVLFIAAHSLKCVCHSSGPKG